MKKQAKVMRERFSDMEETKRAERIEGSAGSGLVKLQINGHGELQNIKIDPACVTADDLEGLEDLIVAAFQNAFSKIERNKMNDFPPGLL
jgi:hypothetical protein